MNILVPTDFSEMADNAIDYAAMLAAKLQARIILLHVIPPTGIWWTSINNELIAGARQKQESIRQRLLSKGMRSSDIGSHIISDFPLTRYINEFISDHQVEFIVMGTHGSGGLAKTKLGSFTMGMIDNVPIPVFAVPAGVKSETISQILYPTDLEDVLCETRKLLPLAQAFDATIHIVHLPQESVASELLAHHSLLEIGKLSGYSRTTTEVVQGESIIRLIDQQIKTKNADLLAMFAHKKGFFEKLFKGSRSDQASEELQVPILVYRKAEKLS